MHLYALKDNTLIFAPHAQKGTLYRCPECFGSVRLRGGHFHQKHFYHLRSHSVCRQQQKSIAHLQVQLHLKSLIPTLFLEKPMPSIGRIADAVWEERKLIFEVQCSPISQEEVEKRNQDYATLGYSVIWLLHDRCFNRQKLTPVEIFLRNGRCFYVNGKWIYDQKDVIRGPYRLFRGPPIFLDPRVQLLRKCRTIILKPKPRSWLTLYQHLLLSLLEKISM